MRIYGWNTIKRRLEVYNGREWTKVYSADPYGFDDLGALEIDWTHPPWDRPQKPEEPKLLESCDHEWEDKPLFTGTYQQCKKCKGIK